MYLLKIIILIFIMIVYFVMNYIIRMICNNHSMMIRLLERFSFVIVWICSHGRSNFCNAICRMCTKGNGIFMSALISSMIASCRIQYLSCSYSQTRYKPYYDRADQDRQQSSISFSIAVSYWVIKQYEDEKLWMDFSTSY